MDEQKIIFSNRFEKRNLRITKQIWELATQSLLTLRKLMIFKIYTEEPQKCSK